MMFMHQNDADRLANSVDPDQTAPSNSVDSEQTNMGKGAVRSDTVFA